MRVADVRDGVGTLAVLGASKAVWLTPARADALERAREQRRANAAAKRRAQERAAGTAKVLLAGIDTLNLSSRAELRPSLVKQLLELKEQAIEAQQTEGPAPTWRSSALGLELEVLSTGSKKGALLLQSDELVAVLSPTGPKNLPRAYVELKSSMLWRSWEVAAQKAEGLLRELSVEDATLDVQVSRLDLAVDFCGWAPTPATLEQVIGRVVRRDPMKLPSGERFTTEEVTAAIAEALKKQKRHVQLHQRGRRFTGFTFGGGQLLARLYNKSVELLKSGKAWFVPLWEKAGYRGEVLDGHVWRLEFQLRREPLRTADVMLGDNGDTVELKAWADVKRGLNELWGYLTGKWLTVRLPRTGNERVRLHPAWKSIKAAQFVDAPRGELYRHQAKLQLERCTGAFAGYSKRELALFWKERQLSPDRSRLEADLKAMVDFGLKHYELRHGEELFDAARSRWKQHRAFEAMFRPKPATA
jgi:hypothetical protein